MGTYYFTRNEEATAKESKKKCPGSLEENQKAAVSSTPKEGSENLN